jgi:hypothetical protein
LHDNDGTEVWLSDKGRTEKKEESEKRYVPPGKVEAPTYGFVSFEIPGDSIVKECHIIVQNDVEGSEYKFGMPLFVGYVSAEGPWFSVSGTHQYLQGKRVLSAGLKNWSHTYGRNFWIFVRYEIGSRVTVTRKEGGGRESQSEDAYVS